DRPRRRPQSVGRDVRLPARHLRDGRAAVGGGLGRLPAGGDPRRRGWHAGGVRPADADARLHLLRGQPRRRQRRAVRAGDRRGVAGAHARHRRHGVRDRAAGGDAHQAGRLDYNASAGWYELMLVLLVVNIACLIWRPRRPTQLTWYLGTFWILFLLSTFAAELRYLREAGYTFQGRYLLPAALGLGAVLL